MTIDKNNYKALVLTGFHRSATSATANYLSNAGLNMGQELMAPNINNTLGYFEDIPAVKLHESELTKNKTSWQFHDEVSLHTNTDYLSKYINQRDSQGDFWSVKDPRICLFLDDWHKALGDNGCYFFVVRHWSSCVESLLNRHSKNLAYGLKEVTLDNTDIRFWKQPDLAAKMWLSYNRRLLSFAKKHPNKTLISTQRCLFNGAPVLSAINQKFSFKLNTNAESPFDNSLFRDVSNISIFETMSYTLQQELNQVWSEILSLTDLKTKNEDPVITTHDELPASALDKIRSCTPKKNEGLHSKSITNTNNDWLFKLKTISNASEMGKFLNKSTLDKLGGVGPEEWLYHVEHVFLSNNKNLSSECTEVLFASVKFLMRLGEFSLAVEQLNKRISISGSSPYIEMFLGQCYQNLNQLDLSKSFFEKTIKAKPNKGIFHTHYAKLLAKLEEHEKAEYHFNLAYELESNNAVCALGYSQFLDNLNKTTEAIDLLRSYLTRTFHPMVNALLIKLESKIDINLMLERYFKETKDRASKTNLHQWLANSCSLLSYNFTELDLIKRCFQHWGNLNNDTRFLGLITRCKDEYFIAEFANYYLGEGVDYIYIIDDSSTNKNIYDKISDNPKIKIIYENNIIPTNYASKLYKSVKHLYEWMIYIDVDEFIAPKKTH